MLQNLKELSTVTSNMQDSVNAIFAGNENNSQSAVSTLLRLKEKSEDLVIKSETELSNAFAIFIDKEDMMQLVNIFDNINNDLFKLGTRRTISPNLKAINSFENEIKSQKVNINKIAEIVNILQDKPKFKNTKEAIASLKMNRAYTSKNIDETLKKIYNETNFANAGAQIWERELLQTFEDVFELTNRFSTILSELAVKYD
jgi:uncharacterized protein Yka (UPF0111/DUF47 family)